MDDAAVVAGLVRREVRLLVEDDDAGPRTPLQEAERRGEPDEPGSDDSDVRAFGRRFGRRLARRRLAHLARRASRPGPDRLHPPRSG